MEGVVIVASILLAFSVDAWWDRQRDRDDQAEVLRAVEGEFRAYRQVLDDAGREATELADSSAVLIDALQVAPQAQLVTVPESTVRLSLEWPTLRIPVSSVDLAGIVDPELGSLIRQWQAEVRTTVDRYNAARELVFLQVRPQLAPDVDLARLDRRIADFYLRGIEPPADGTVRVRHTPQLINALSGRASLLEAAAVGVTRLEGWIDRIEMRLAEELDR